MAFKPRHAAVLAGILSIAALSVAAATFFILQADISSRITKERNVRQAKTAELERHIASLERSVVSLKEDGYVEPDTFADFAAAARAATVSIRDSGGRLRGSGFFVSEDGLIATAKHVVNGIDGDMLVRTREGADYAGVYVDEHDTADIALVRIPGNGYPALALGFFENTEIGEEAGFAGFVQGFREPLVHRGVISGKGVNESGSEILTINSFVNSGNSGGPVFSAVNGRVIAVVGSRRSDVPVDKLISPDSVPDGFTVGNVNPLKLSVELYNETLRTVGDVSQVGIGIVYSANTLRDLINAQE